MAKAKMDRHVVTSFSASDMEDVDRAAKLDDVSRGNRSEFIRRACREVARRILGPSAADPAQEVRCDSVEAGFRAYMGWFGGQDVEYNWADFEKDWASQFSHGPTMGTDWGPWLRDLHERRLDSGLMPE